MISRLRYLIGRAREAPTAVVLRIVWLRILPWIRYPQYALPHFRRPSIVAAKNFITFGDLIRDGLAGSSECEMVEFVDRGEFPCLGYGILAIPKGRDWHCDPIHSHQWLQKYFARIDFVAADTKCDVKIPWEASRLQFLVWLAHRVAVNCDAIENDVFQFVQIVDDWITHNPVGYGVNWTSSMEVAIRAVNLSLATAVIARFLDREFLNRVTLSLEEHLAYLERFPEFSDVPGNHYLATLMGELVLSHFLYDTNDPRLEEKSRKFVEEGERQFENDGCHIERAPAYHRLTLEMIAIVFAMSIGKHCRYDTALFEILRNGISFCHAIGSEYQLPIIGDYDSGHVLWFGDEGRSYRGLGSYLLRLVAVDNDLEDNHWANWICALSRGQVVDLPRIEDSKEYKIWRGNGFVSAASGDLRVVMRVGKQGLEGRAPHDHDDALSVWIFRKGIDLVVDQGCHSYTLDPAIRAKYISSRAHNVIQPMGQDRFATTTGSVFKTVRGAPVASSYSANDTDDGPQLVADLAVDSASPFKHHRRVVKSASESITIIDDWKWKLCMSGEMRWHFGPGIELQRLSELANYVLIRDDRVLGTFQLSAELDCEIDCTKYDFSPSYGSIVSCCCMRIRFPDHESGLVTSEFQMAV